MNLVILDGYTLNPGDLGWSVLESFGRLTAYDRTNPDQFAGRAGQATALLVNKFVLTDALLDQAPNLTYIGVTATGYNNVDVAAARKRGIVVTNVKGYGTASVAQHTFALLLELVMHTGRHSQSVRAGDWGRSPDFSYRQTPLVELAGKTLGLVGYGDIGGQVAAIGRAFGMTVLVNRKRADIPADNDSRLADLPTLFAESDVVSLHCPLTGDNEGFVNRTLLETMKPSAYLINTSRGGLITEADLASALHRGVIAGTGLDVLTSEPPLPDNPLLTAPNCLITPHLAWATRESRQRLMQELAHNLTAFQQGQARNVIT